eukprot:6197990-Pleurochrysis_carterae.AAC.2
MAVQTFVFSIVLVTCEAPVRRAVRCIVLEVAVRLTNWRSQCASPCRDRVLRRQDLHQPTHSSTISAAENFSMLSEHSVGDTAKLLQRPEEFTFTSDWTSTRGTYSRYTRALFDFQTRAQFDFHMQRFSVCGSPDPIGSSQHRRRKQSSLASARSGESSTARESEEMAATLVCACVRACVRACVCE